MTPWDDRGLLDTGSERNQGGTNLDHLMSLSCGFLFDDPFGLRVLHVRMQCCIYMLCCTPLLQCISPLRIAHQLYRLCPLAARAAY